MNKYIRIHENDNVAVALTLLAAGEHISAGGYDIILAEDIPRGHKFALCKIPSASPVMKYGACIGLARTDIEPGCHVHTHNLRTALNETSEYTYTPETDAACGTSKEPGRSTAVRTFQGYLRPDGRAGIRNEIWIIPTVGCVNSVGQHLASLAREKYAAVPSIDAIVAFQHPYGCSQLGDDQDNTRKILADLCMHPNAGGVLLLGLGCENSGIEEIKAFIPDFEERQIQCLVCQDVEDEIKEGLALLDGLIETASRNQRQPIPVSSLVVGVKCGGSDGLSGITANPLVGRFTDCLTGDGGSVLMTEVPEMFGAETLLLNRCMDQEVFQKAAGMIQGFKDYFSRHDQPVYENPSPGNKAGGISTLEDKSLGCTQKAGTAAVVDVLDYGEPVKARGLSLLYGPGNDLVSSTALAASGAQLILFTTGRGTPFAAPVPTVKISSNTPLHDKKNRWIDFNAGTIVENPDYDMLTDQLYDYVLRVAGGELVKAEQAGYHDMAIFKQNITL